MNRIVLKPGREKSLMRRHPWVFSGAIERVSGSPAIGETVEVVSPRGEFLAYGAYSPHSQIRVRAVSFDQRAKPDETLIARLVARAIEMREALSLSDFDACRLIHGESDGLPGVVADRYADTVVLQCLSAFAERWKAAIATALARGSDVKYIYERSDAEVRSLEGLQPCVGALVGGEPPMSIAIHEGRVRYLVDVRGGQKTGFFLDQRDNRSRVRVAAADVEVLDAFCYTGGFTIAALGGGARMVTAIDSSRLALDQARVNVTASGLERARVHFLEADAFSMLRTLRDQGQRFDVVVLDPPKFAPTERHVARAARAYKDINLSAFKLLRPGGLLFTFSCSGAIGAELFQSIVAGAALDAGVEGRVIAYMGAGGDHPVALNFPEGEYLKGLVVKV